MLQGGHGKILEGIIFFFQNAAKLQSRLVFFEFLSHAGLTIIVILYSWGYPIYHWIPIISMVHSITFICQQSIILNEDVFLHVISPRLSRRSGILFSDKWGEQIQALFDVCLYTQVIFCSSELILCSIMDTCKSGFAYINADVVVWQVQYYVVYRPLSTKKRRLLHVCVVSYY